MRRPNRNIEIFSMSVLDMFASALGAFIIVSVILFPYFNKDVFKEVEIATAALKSKADELKQENEQKKRLDEQLARQEARALQRRAGLFTSPARSRGGRARIRGR